MAKDGSGASGHYRVKKFSFALEEIYSNENNYSEQALIQWVCSMFKERLGPTHKEFMLPAFATFFGITIDEKSMEFRAMLEKIAIEERGGQGLIPTTLYIEKNYTSLAPQATTRLMQEKVTNKIQSVPATIRRHCSLPVGDN